MGRPATILNLLSKEAMERNGVATGPYYCPNKHCNTKFAATAHLGRHYTDTENAKRKQCVEARHQLDLFRKRQYKAKAKGNGHANGHARVLAKLPSKPRTGRPRYPSEIARRKHPKRDAREAAFCVHCGSPMAAAWSFCGACGNASQYQAIHELRRTMTARR